MLLYQGCFMVYIHVCITPRVSSDTITIQHKYSCHFWKNDTYDSTNNKFGSLFMFMYFLYQDVTEWQCVANSYKFGYYCRDSTQLFICNWFMIKVILLYAYLKWCYHVLTSPVNILGECVMIGNAHHHNIMWNFDIFLLLSLNKLPNKQ